MNISNIFHFLIFIVLVGAGCKPKQQTSIDKFLANADNSKTSLDWPGTYLGILPCADCEGIQTRLVINSDLTFNLETRYNGKDQKVFQSKGTFSWNESGNKITPDTPDKQIYLVGENRLFHLDKDGNRITGNLADNYIIEKEKVEITGKYWKLVRLNGKPVETNEREAFISFDEGENRVHGNSSCNMFNGNYALLEGNRIKFSPFAMTKMACIGNNIETELMQIFEKTTSYSLTLNELILQDEFETTLAKFESEFFK